MRNYNLEIYSREHDVTPEGTPQPALWEINSIKNYDNLEIYRVTIFVGMMNTKCYLYEHFGNWEWMGKRFFRILDVRPRDIYAICEENRIYGDRELKNPVRGYYHYGIRHKVTSDFTKVWPAAVPYIHDIMKILNPYEF